MNTGAQLWIRVSLFNLFLVALLGLLMRYKIGFSFPFFDQKSLLFSHYHFAFFGWIGHALMTLMVQRLESRNPAFSFLRYKGIIGLNLLGSYGMLVAFIATGYGTVSTFFLGLSLMASFAFAVRFWTDMRLAGIRSNVSRWFKASLVFNLLSAVGVLVIAYMMITRNLHQNAYLAWVYYFLHFQYNGWFFFACMGLFMDYTAPKIPIADGWKQGAAFWLFALSCVPAYFLSTLWLPIPGWLYALVILSAVAQAVGWILILRRFKASGGLNRELPGILQYILLFVGVSVSIKLLLQLGSTVPVISKLAFGFRPVVIAYLHLVLLAIITLFLLFYIYAANLMETSRKILLGLVLFSIGVLFNEVVLAVQGIGAFSYTMLPYANELLLGAAVFLVAGIWVLFYHSLHRK